MLKEKHQDNAKVVDGKLILSFPNAITPVVWQMDLSDAKASALEVNDNKDGFSLILKTPKGETVQIASFEKKEQSVNGLMAASKALEKAQGQIHVGSTKGAKAKHTMTAPPPQKSGFWKKFFMIIGLFVVAYIILSIITYNIGPKPPTSLQSASSKTQQQPARTQSGVPVSADEFLKGR